MVGGRCQDKTQTTLNPNQPQQPWSLNKSSPPPTTLSWPCNKHNKLETKSAHLPQDLPVLVTIRGSWNDGHEVQHWGMHCYTIALTCPDKSSIALIALIVRAMPQLCVLLILSTQPILVVLLFAPNWLMDPPFNSKKKKSTPGGFSQLKSSIHWRKIM